jgi:hypothetical protein
VQQMGEGLRRRRERFAGLRLTSERPRPRSNAWLSHSRNFEVVARG